MKSVLKCVLSIFILFSSVDLSMINLFSSLDFLSTQSIVVSDIVKVQYDLLQKTKTVVANVCDSIVKDITSLLVPYTTNKIFFDKIQTNTRLYMSNYLNYVKLILLTAISNNSFVVKNISLLLFFFGFIFLFILKYLGLLFTFGKITVSQQYVKAYSI